MNFQFKIYILKHYHRLRIRPRFLTNVSQRNLSTTVLGRNVSIPIGISPTAMQKMAHPDGECATARGPYEVHEKLNDNKMFLPAAAHHGTVFILSTIATSSIEDIAQAAPDGTNWFQLYIYIDRYTSNKQKILWRYKYIR